MKRTWLQYALFALSIICVGTIPSVTKAAPVPIDEALRKTAEKIVQEARAKKVPNLGVLKFHVQVGKGKPQDDAGTLNMAIANRLEAALILADPDEKLGIIERASDAVVRA